MRKIHLVIGAAVFCVSAVAVASFFVMIRRPAAVVPTGSQTASRSAYSLGLLPPGFTSPFHVAVADGAKEEAKKLALDLSVEATASEGDFVGQAVLMQGMLDRGVQAIAANPVQTAALIDMVKVANQKRIPVMMYNTISPFAGGTITSLIGYDQWLGGEKLGQYSCELLAKKGGTSVAEAKGKVFILKGLEGIHSHRRTQGFKSGLAACPNVVIVGEQMADWLRDKAQEVATAALQQAPDIDVFYGTSDEMGIGAALAAKKLGLVVNKDFFVVSIDGNQPTLDLVKSGDYTATLGVYPKLMGTVLIDTMKKVLDGQAVPEVVLTPSTVVTKDNVEDYMSGATWTEPVAGSLEEDNGKPTSGN
jgi:ribose transport system substrate-binding protein